GSSGPAPIAAAGSRPTIHVLVLSRVKRTGFGASTRNTRSITVASPAARPATFEASAPPPRSSPRPTHEVARTSASSTPPPAPSRAHHGRVFRQLPYGALPSAVVRLPESGRGEGRVPLRHRDPREHGETRSGPAGPGTPQHADLDPLDARPGDDHRCRRSRLH